MMAPLSVAVAEYIGLRRSLGSEFRCEAGILRRFATFAHTRDATHVTTALVLRWAEQISDRQPGTVARAVSVVRRFAVWLAADDPLTEVPPMRLVRGKALRKKPFIHSTEQIMALLEAARGLESSNGLRGLTSATLFGLIAVTGMRVSEAINLDRADVDLATGVLRIVQSKFGKSRFVPVHPTTLSALRQYALRRDRILTRSRTHAFFVDDNGKRACPEVMRNNFAVASRRVGQRGPLPESGPERKKRGRGPRIHDLRHRFAVATMLDWYRTGQDVERQIPRLSIYLGHRSPRDTQWYIEAVPELLSLASGRITRNERRVMP